MLENAMANAPLWLIEGLFYLALVIVCVAGGLVKGRGTLPEGKDHDGYIVSAVLALLGLLVAFTFSMALSRYDTRRATIVAEANTISTAWLRAELVSGSDGDALRQSMRHYADVRLRIHHAEDMSAVERDTATEQRTVWAAVHRAVLHMEGPSASGLALAVTQMFDAASIRKAERDARLPGRVLDLVSLYALVAAAITGYAFGRWQSWRQALASNALFVLLALALGLILDLDRPWSGEITVSAQPMIDVRASMDS